jgi:hypothetical protein
MAGRNYQASVIKEHENRIVLEGLPGLLNQLKEVGTPTKAMARAAKAAGMVVVQYAKGNTHFKHTSKSYGYDGKSPGSLLKTVRAAEIHDGVVVRAGLDSVPYANPIHWGWFYDRNWFIQKNIKPNPFLSRALGYNRYKITYTYLKNIDALIKKSGYPPPKVRK